MKVTQGTYMTKNAVTVRLSERNLLQLNELWDEAKKDRALPSLYRFDLSEDTFLTVVIEADEWHYKDRPADRGGFA